MHDHNHHHQMVESDSSRLEYLKFFTVIVLIFTVSWLLYENFGGSDFSDAMRWFMGVFLLVFAAFKFAGYKMFVEMFPMYDLIAMRFKPYAWAYPFIELVLGLLFIFDAVPVLRNLSVMLIMGVGALGVLKQIMKKGQAVKCACLGNIIKLPLSTVSLAEDVTMFVMAGAMLVIG